MLRLAAAVVGICGLACAAPARAACIDATVPLHALPGTPPGAVRVRGVVTAVFPDLGGFFLEAPRSHWDGRPATSEGLFVYMGRHATPFRRGDDVEVGGRYRRFHGTPEISRPQEMQRCGHAPLPPAVSVNLPLERSGGWDSLVGMRLRFAQTLTVDDLHDFGRYGEVRASAGGRLYAPTALTAPGPASARLARANAARSVWIDDGSSHAHPAAWALAGRHFDAEHPLRAGQRLEHLSGIAYRAFGRDLVEAQSADLDAGANPRRNVADLELPAGLRIVSFNVENYFNRASSGPAFPTERGARNAAQFACQTRKLVAALARMRPAVAALQEIENNGYGAAGALAALVAALNRAAPGAPYRLVDPGLPRLGSDLIAPALLYDSSRLEPAGRTAVLAASATAPEALAAGLKRPALAASFRVRASGWVFTVASVHLRSKLSACGKALDSYSGAGHCARARAFAARRVSEWLMRDPTGVSAPALALAGDFNAYQREDAIGILRGAGWQTLPSLAATVPHYTETARGGAGELDYVFASQALANRVRAVRIWHGDADEAPALSYRGRPACSGPAAPFRASDHDPVIVVVKGS